MNKKRGYIWVVHREGSYCCIIQNYAVIYILWYHFYSIKKLEKNVLLRWAKLLLLKFIKDIRIYSLALSKYMEVRHLCYRTERHNFLSPFLLSFLLFFFPLFLKRKRKRKENYQSRCQNLCLSARSSFVYPNHKLTAFHLSINFFILPC